MKMEHELLVIGHPRTGTGYMSKLLCSYGLDIGHEKILANGTSNWMYAVIDEHYPYGVQGWQDKTFKYIIHNIRNPYDALPSIMGENQQQQSYLFRKKHIFQRFGIDLDQYNPHEKAVWSFLLWNQMITELKPDIVVRVEHCENEIKKFLLKKNLIQDKSIDVFSDKKYNTRPLKKQQFDVNVLSSEAKDALNKFISKHYRKIMI